MHQPTGATPGNGCTNARKSNWYGRAQEALQETLGIFSNCLAA